MAVQRPANMKSLVVGSYASRSRFQESEEGQASAVPDVSEFVTSKPGTKTQQG